VAFTVTTRATTLASGSGPYLSDSFTPAANSLLFALTVAISGQSTNSGVSNHDSGGAWELVGSLTGGQQGIEWELWACITGSSPSDQQVSVAHNSNVHRMGIACFDIQGADVSGAVADAFGSIGSPQVGQFFTGQPHTLTCTCAAHEGSGSLSLFVATSVNAANATDQSLDDFTVQIDNQDFLGKWTSVAYKETEDTSIDYVTVDDNVTLFGALLEVKAAPAGGGYTAQQFNSSAISSGGMQELKGGLQ